MKPLAEAVKEIKKRPAGFDETVEVHFNLSLDVKQADQTLRAPANLPHGTGKEVKVAVMSSKKVAGADLQLSESDLPKLEKGEIKPKTDFDVLIVEPSFMGKLAKLGPILGPSGVMPNPKTGTVTDNIEKAVTQFKKGKVELKNEPEAPILHTIIGKVSFKEKELIDNFMEVFNTLKQNKPQKAKPDWVKNCFITSTMGPAIQVDLRDL